jgi:YfiH family protein
MNTALPSDVLIVPDWPAPANVRAVVTTRHLPGNSLPPFDAFNLGLRGGEDEPVVRSNRDLLWRALNLPAPPHWLRQVHGTQVVEFADRASPGAPADVAEPEGDAAIARDAGVVLAILTADCLPILLCAEEGAEIAAVHAGWRGLSAGVVECCVAKMRTPPQRLMAWLGPAIGARSFEVGAAVRDAFVEADPAAAVAFVATGPGHWLCNLYTLAHQRLHALGVTKVHGGGFDTLSDPRFYSYRRDAGASGRFASLIWSELPR